MPSRLRRIDEYGHTHFVTISCYRRLQFFRHDSVKRVFVDGMRRTRDKLRIRWVGYVIMPEHVHLLVFPTLVDSDRFVSISTVLQELKQDAGRHGKEALRRVWADRHTLGTRPLDVWAHSATRKPFWKTRAYDFNVIEERTLHEKLDYMHKNPITRGLVDRADQWPWSSYRFYELGDESIIEMDWDHSWPIV